VAKLTEMSDEDAAATLLRIFRQACDAYDPASGASHPGQVIKKMRMDTAEWVRASATGSAPGSSERQIQSQDDVQPEKDAGSNGGNGGPTPAQDSRSSFAMGLDGVPRFYQVREVNGEVLTTVLTGDAAIVARAGMSSPTRVKRMADAIPGYNNRK
jgi:hypothetical protein